MNVKDLILAKKDLVVSELYEWAETFEYEIDDDGEPTMESYNMVFDLATRLDKDQLRNDDIETILFHIAQINYNEVKIKL